MKSEIKALRAKLEGETGTADWALLAAHARADHLIVVGEELGLLDAATAVANNDADRVGGWIDDALLTKPDAGLQAEYAQAESLFFQFVIVAPFVMAQQVKLSS